MTGTFSLRKPFMLLLCWATYKVKSLKLCLMATCIRFDTFVHGQVVILTLFQGQRSLKKEKKRHDAWLHGVHRMCEMVAVSCGTSPIRSEQHRKSTTLVGIQHAL